MRFEAQRRCLPWAIAVLEVGAISLVGCSETTTAPSLEGNDNDPNGIFRKTEAYDPTGDRWMTLSPMRTGRHGIGAAVVNGAIYIPGGATRSGFGAVADQEVFTF